ncbi:MAG: hypothetical protein M3Q45_02655, partial [Chloroflexota bacterium]|nr:hypothetical protein [Chloroflexota bacterium]
LTGGLLLLLTLAAGWQLNQNVDLAYADGFFAEVTDPALRQLATDIATLSAQRQGDPTQAPVQVQMAAQPDPVLGWYLRDLRRLTWVLAPGATVETEAPLVITLTGDADTNDLLANYMGSEYDIRTRWLPTQLLLATPDAAQAAADANANWAQRVRPFLRWMIYREVKPPPVADTVVLWVPVVGQ